MIVAGPGMDMLQKENLVVAESRVDLARALIGVGVKAGARRTPNHKSNSGRRVRIVYSCGPLLCT